MTEGCLSHSNHSFLKKKDSAIIIQWYILIDVKDGIEEILEFITHTSRKTADEEFKKMEVASWVPRYLGCSVPIPRRNGQAKKDDERETTEIGR